MYIQDGAVTLSLWAREGSGSSPDGAEVRQLADPAQHAGLILPVPALVNSCPPAASGHAPRGSLPLSWWALTNQHG